MTKKRIFLAIALLLVVAGGYYWYHRSQAATSVVRYVTAIAEKGTLTTAVTASGNVIVDESASVDPTITGTVQGLSVKVGDEVRKGQLLFAIENNQLGVSVSQSYQQLQSSKQQLLQAKADLHSFEKDGTGTHKDHIALEKKVDVARLSVTSAEANYQNQLETAAKRRVIAPIAGTVNAVNVKNGDDLSRLSGNNASQAPIIIGDLKTMKAQVQVNEVDIAQVNLGQRTMLTLDAFEGMSMTGRVEKLDSLGTVSQGVVTYNVTIGFDDLDARIRPEMSVTAAIITSVVQDVVTVPTSAVKTQNGTTSVEVMVGETPERRTVETGATNGTDTEIRAGVREGEAVVTQTIDPSATAGTANQSGGLRLPGLGGSRTFGR